MSSVEATEVRGARYHALDGLRGIAAVMVLFHHALLVKPPAADGTMPDWRWLLTYTPLKLANAGPEAVVIFFVLSGFVLAGPVLRRPGYDWYGYYPRRVIRLLAPVAGSVVLAALFILANPQTEKPGLSDWVARSSSPQFNWHDILNALNLLNGSYTRVNNPLWSIQWEMLFSMTLPVFVVLALVLRRYWYLGVGLALLITWIGVLTSVGALIYLPVFLIGVLLACGQDDLTRAIGRLNASRWRGLVWALVIIGGAALLILPWLVGPAGRTVDWLLTLLTAGVPLGAALIVVAALGSRGFSAVLSVAPVQYAGKVSFSLYLVHVPVIIFLRHLLVDADDNAVIAVAIPSAVIVAVLFYYAVEAPSHRLSGWVGRRSTELVRGSLSAKPKREAPARATEDRKPVA